MVVALSVTETRRSNTLIAGLETGEQKKIVKGLWMTEGLSLLLHDERLTILTARQHQETVTSETRSQFKGKLRGNM